MENIEEKAADLAGHAEELVKTWKRLSLLNAAEKAANISSAGISMLMIIITGVFVFLLGGFALSWWLGNILASRAGGFLLGAAFFLLLTVVLILLRKKIIFPFFRDLIIRKLYD